MTEGSTGQPPAGLVAELASELEALGAADEDGEIHAHLGRVRSDLLRLVDRHADELKTAAAVLLLELDQHRNLFAAGRTVGGPEVEHDDLLAQVFEPDAAAVRLRPAADGCRALGHGAVRGL